MVEMGTLKPGATYIYERAEGIVYAREEGANPSERFVIGYESADAYDVHSNIRENQLWNNIRLAAQTNPALQEALDRAMVIYELSKNNE
jgi:hypothetical protein